MPSSSTAATSSTSKMKPRPKKRPIKPKMTKDERRAKYTNLAKERRQRQFNQKKHSNTICYNCRKKGHAVSECPLNGNGNGNGNDNGNGNGDTAGTCTIISSGATTSTSAGYNNICYKCGQNDHSLKACPKLTREEKQSARKNGGKLNYHTMKLPFATCFICKQKGHLSSQCDKNKHGIYVNDRGGGGGCKFCGKFDHLFAYCPTKNSEKNSNHNSENNNSNSYSNNYDVDDEGSAGNVDEYLEEEIESSNSGGGIVDNHIINHIDDNNNDNANNVTRKPSSSSSSTKKKKKVVQF